MKNIINHPSIARGDFVTRYQDSIVYIQATYLTVANATREREFSNLRSIPDNYPKYVISLDEWSSGGNVDVMFCQTATSFHTNSK